MRRGEELYGKAIFSLSFDQLAEARSAFERLSEHIPTPADRLYVCQPPFSKQLHDLEAEIGVDLFQRKHKGVALTAAGKTF